MAAGAWVGSLTTRWRRLAFPILALAKVLLLFSALSAVINPVLIAVRLAVLLNPVVNFAAASDCRVLTVSLLYVLLLGCAGGFDRARQFEQLGARWRAGPSTATSTTTA